MVDNYWVAVKARPVTLLRCTKAFLFFDLGALRNSKCFVSSACQIKFILCLLNGGGAGEKSPSSSWTIPFPISSALQNEHLSKSKEPLMHVCRRGAAPSRFVSCDATPRALSAHAMYVQSKCK